MQISISKDFPGWPSRHCEAVLQVNTMIEQLADKYGFEVERFIEDGMGWCSTGFVFIDELGPVMLEQFDHIKANGTSLYVDASLDPYSTARALVEALSLSPESIVGRASSFGADCEWITVKDPRF
jgi:hypothetical protein